MSEPHAERAATPEQFVEALITRLFKDIPLTEAQAVAARNVVTRVTREQGQIDIRQPGAWDQLISRSVERDAALAALLPSETDRARFEARAAELQREQATIRPGW